MNSDKRDTRDVSDNMNTRDVRVDMNSKDTAGEAEPVRLSARLQTVAGFVRQGSRIADIGTDHGYIPVYLAQTGRILSALAMDVRPGPLERARTHVEEYEERVRVTREKSALAVEPGGREAMAEMSRVSRTAACHVETRLSDGLRELRPGEADTVIIAGMGGGLIMKILEEGRHVWDSTDHFILSPQSELDKVRRFLASNGFAIEDEAMVKDEGKYYTVMSVRRGRMEYESQAHYLYGRILIGKKDAALKEFLERETRRIEEIIESLEEQEGNPGTPARVSARRERMEELSWIKEAQDEMQ